MKIKITNNILQILDDDGNIVMTYDLTVLDPNSIDNIINEWKNKLDKKQKIVDYIKQKYSDILESDEQ